MNQIKSSRSTSSSFLHKFHGNCYVSAHLQRLQHWHLRGHDHLWDWHHARYIFSSHFRLPSFHIPVAQVPSAIIEVSARFENIDLLRFVKFAPHVSHGRMSMQYTLLLIRRHTNVLTMP